ncbi:cytochrome P450 [Xylogone sp. PMI_703]|nr:cytochrome P450 [Xylogone sp. PMI_703]
MTVLHRYLGPDNATQTLSAFGVVLIVVLWGCYRLLAGPNLSWVPRVGKSSGWLGLRMAEAKRDFLKNGPKILNEGYSKYKHGMFLVQTLNVPRVVLSPKYIEEINRAVPDGALDMVDGLRERLMSSQTNLDVVFRSPMHIEVCKDQLTRNLYALIEPLNEEAGYWLSQRVGGKTEIKGYETMVRVIAGTASRMLGGTRVSRDMEWLETAARYSMDVVTVAMQLRPWPAFMRPFVAPWLDGTKVLARHLQVAKKVFKAEFARRLALADSGEDKKQENPIDMIQWMTESARGSDRNADVLAHNMLFMSLAAVHTSSATLIHALFDLCAAPEYLQGLREEAEKVIGEQGFTLSAINSLKKLDSFMKESQRMNQTVLMTFNRRVAKPIKFSDGATLPAGTYITMPADAVAHEPDIYENPYKFDGLRFYDKRMSAKSEAYRHQFATTGPESLAFGQGKTACPGRFFAAAQIKVVLVHILLNYDVSYPAGQTERPKNIYKGGLVMADRSQKLVFTPRKQ